MPSTLGMMLTMTTYGSWLRGDKRGWVDGGIIWPANPELEQADRGRMKHPPFRFQPDQLERVGWAMGRSLGERLMIRIAAMTVQAWHVHLVVLTTPHPIGIVVKCAKDAIRWELRANQPIWSKGYDKRFIFDQDSLAQRVGYVERHNIRMACPARPWPFIEPL